MRRTPDSLSASTASAQHGVVNVQQLLAAGLSPGALRHRRETGRLDPILPKTLRMGGAPETWEQRLLAALFWAGEGSVASHRSAGALWGFDACGQGVIELTSKRNLRSDRASGIVAHRYSVLPPDETAQLGPIPATTPARTLLDLAAVVHPSRLEVAMDSALRRRLVSSQDLQVTLQRHARCGRRGIRNFRAAVMTRGDGYVPPHPGVERKLARLIANSDLPTPAREHPVFEDGEEVYRIDFAYPDQMLAIEADSWTHHSDRVSWSNDQVRANVLTSQGWRVLRFTYYDVTVRPWYVIETIRRALADSLYRT